MLTTMLLTLTLAASAPLQSVSCPLWLPKDSFRSNNSSEGWVALMPADARLSGGGLLHGAPAEEAYLRPDEAKERRNGNRSEFRAVWQLGQPHAFEVWMFCSYGGQSTLQLFRKVNDRASTCTSTSKLIDGAFTGTVFECR
jgi:hypothetical protein